MSDLKISTRLAVMVGLLSLLLVFVGGIGLYGIKRTNEALATVYEDRTRPMGQVAEIQWRLLDNRLQIANALLSTAPDDIARNTAAVEENMVAISEVWKAFNATTQTPREVDLARSFSESRKSFVQEGLLPAVEALRAQDFDRARQLVAERVRPLYGPVGKGIAELMQLQLDVAKAEFEAANERYDTIRALAVLSTLIGIGLATGLGYLLIRSVSRSLNEAVDVVDAVSVGDLTCPINAVGGDEVARLLQAMVKMKDSLIRVVSDVRRNADSVATASAQIAQGNQDLSGRTEEQASALEETSATMEQLGSTVRHNADNAQQANELAQGACAVAVRGGETVGRVVDMMKGINDSSKKIADIIGVIDSIAFQTNILALNAAVEAARAGEQGRGFAVVASEVRNLAQRSAEAAREIKGLIMASVERVDEGTTLVDQAGETMQEIVKAVQHVTSIMSDISHASIEQSSGVAQVGEAVSQMDQATQQNSALVEESTAAAESLKQQAEQLVRAVAVFRLPQGGSEHQPACVPATDQQPHAVFERRGPNRATNVARPAFGPARSDSMAQTPAEPSATKTGTDDWSSF